MILGHSSQLPSNRVQRHGQHPLSVRSHQGGVIPGGDVQHTQIACACACQDTETILCDAYSSNWAFMFWERMDKYKQMLTMV